MPLLDVSFVLDDPMLADTFSVRRRLNVMLPSGRVQPTPDEFFRDVIGVVTQQSPAEVMKAADGESLPRRIFVASRFQFIAAATDQLGDEVTWNGVLYRCVESLPYSRYGTGFYEAILEFQNAVPPLQ